MGGRASEEDVWAVLFGRPSICYKKHLTSFLLSKSRFLLTTLLMLSICYKKLYEHFISISCFTLGLSKDITPEDISRYEKEIAYVEIWALMKYRHMLSFKV